MRESRKPWFNGYNDSEAACLGMQRIISQAQVSGTLDQIRTRVLEFALEIWKLDPKAGEPEASEQIPPQKIQNIFNTTIHGDTTNVAIGAKDFQQIALTVGKGDWSALERVLREQGLTDEYIQPLHEALKQDETDGETPGDHTRKWLGWLTEQAAKGAIQFATVESLKLITMAVLSFVTGDPGGTGQPMIVA